MRRLQVPVTNETESSSDPVWAGLGQVFERTAYLGAERKKYKTVTETGVGGGGRMTVC